MSYFMETAVNIEGNKKLRTPQIEAYLKIREYFVTNPSGEALVVLPTGTGKSGLISIAPFSVSSKRVLIITPGLVTKKSIQKTQEALEDNFWVNFDIIFNPADLPILSEYSSGILYEHLEQSHIVYSNIHKLGSARDGGLINRVAPDFFDLIIIDEAHHAPAQSWGEVLAYFEGAKRLHVTGTPFRGDNQEVPGEKIHETPLSEVMRDRYVSWLRKETVNAHELYFIMPNTQGKRFSKNEILEIKDKEWLEKSVALSEECSRDVIEHSIKKLEEFKHSSPKVPHKILAVGCSIKHAEDLHTWFQEYGLTSVIVHSEMEQEALDEAFLTVDTHQCHVVISVNMLMEGYDHKYLTVLALFRPYRSLNAFAQVVGRVLRTIPEDEITDFAIDNNAMVIYHQETGLDAMWSSFQKEVDRAKHQRVKEYSQLDMEYEAREQTLAGVESGETVIAGKDSYLDDLDFNELFSNMRAEIETSVETKIDKFRKDPDIDDEVLQALKEQLIKKETQKISDEIDPNLIEKRPDLARKQMREILTKKAQDEVASLLSDLSIDDKATDLAPKFASILQYVKTSTPNDGTLMMFINAKLHSKFGPVKERENDVLLLSINWIPNVIDELRSMLS